MLLAPLLLTGCGTESPDESTVTTISRTEEATGYTDDITDRWLTEDSIKIYLS